MQGRRIGTHEVITCGATTLAPMKKDRAPQTQAVESSQTYEGLEAVNRKPFPIIFARRAKYDWSGELAACKEL